jgi:hypothetical protein
MPGLAQRIETLSCARPSASPDATLVALMHVLADAQAEAESIGLAQSAEGLGAIARFCLAEFQARHGVRN